MPLSSDRIRVTTTPKVVVTAANPKPTVTITIDGISKAIAITVANTCPVGHSLYAPYRLA